MPGALTHTRITWSLLPMAPQVPGVTAGSPFRPWCWGHFFVKRCTTCILVVGDVLEHCLVVGCVLGVVRLEVRLIAGLLPSSSGKSERCICSTLRKLITSVN
jgi:hypothetical protein